MLDQVAHEKLPSIPSSTYMGLKVSGIPLRTQINQGGVDAQDGQPSPRRLGVWETYWNKNKSPLSMKCAAADLPEIRA